MKLTIRLISVLMIGASGCTSPTARQVAQLGDYHATDQDRHEQDDSFASIDRIAKQHLRQGMTESQVRRIMGNPMIDQGPDKSRVDIWTYLLSFSGTWTYSVAFLDGKVAYFGKLNPQWLGHRVYDTCTDSGVKLIHDARKQERNAEPAPGHVPSKAAADGVL